MKNLSAIGLLFKISESFPEYKLFKMSHKLSHFKKSLRNFMRAFNFHTAAKRHSKSQFEVANAHPNDAFCVRIKDKKTVEK